MCEYLRTESIKQTTRLILESSFNHIFFFQVTNATIINQIELGKHFSLTLVQWQTQATKYLLFLEK